jgi:hypothetical protein
MKTDRMLLSALGLVLAMLFCFGRANDAEANLLAAFEFDVGAGPGGTVTDVSGSPDVQVGTLMDHSYTHGGALHLDGTGDCLQFPNEPELYGLDTMTIAAWVNTASAVTNLRRIVEHRSNFYFWGQTGLLHYTTHGASSQVNSTSSPAIGTWMHVAAITQTGQPAMIYVNGVYEASSSTNMPAMPSNSPTFQIGATAFGAGFWDGMIDDVGIWDHALTPSEIYALGGRGVGYYIRMTPTGRFVPEPGTLALTVMGLLGALNRARRRRK